jgi:hypothetical protein
MSPSAGRPPGVLSESPAIQFWLVRNSPGVRSGPRTSFISNPRISRISLLGPGHQAAIMLELREAVLVVCDSHIFCPVR